MSGEEGMSFVLKAVKGIVYFLLFSSVLEQLVGDTRMEKYIRFFTGLLLCLVVVNSITKGTTPEIYEENIKEWYEEGPEWEERFEEQENLINETEKELTEKYKKEEKVEENSQNHEAGIVNGEKIQKIEEINIDKENAED